MIAAIRVALASGGPTAADELLGAFSKHDIGGLAPGERITWLRQLALTLLGVAETGTVADAQRAAVAACLLPHFPTGDERVDQDMAEILAFVDAPGLLDKAVPLLTPLRPSAPPAWAEVATRNASYGGAIQAMLANMPPAGQLALAYALCRVEHGWTLDQRRALFEFLAAARQCKGGASYDGYLQKMIDAAWETCTPAEQNALAEVVDKARAELPKFRATPPAGPGRSWQLADAQALVEDGLAGRDLARGHNLFHAIGCASCHYFAGEGGNHGPDLTSLGNKFAAAEVLEAILLPDKVISDQYSASVVTRKDGSTLLGRAARTTHDGAEVWQVVTASADGEVVFVPVDAVASVEPSPRSPMPNGLLDALNPDELRDLVAFLLSRGVR